MILQKLYKQKLIHPPLFVVNDCTYLTQMGSAAYGVSNDISDVDIYGFCVPPLDLIFPHQVSGEILGFGRQVQRFEQWSEHHIVWPDKQREYDFSVYNIVKYFSLVMENNPNMIDSLFTPDRCVLHSSNISEYLRSRRREFLHKGSWHKFKGYSYSQFNKIRQKVNAQNPARNASIEQWGYDVKYAYHLVRLLNEVEQILVEHDLDLERNREQLKSIRRGEWTIDQIEDYFKTKEASLETVYAESKLRHSPDEAAIKSILMECLEMHFGSLERLFKKSEDNSQLINDLKQLIQKYERV